MNELEALPADSQQALSLLEARGTKAEKTFAELVAGTAVVEGRTLRDKAELLNAPHIITSVSFRPMGEGKGARDFVSVEATDVNDLAIVYNDGSTGVRRQIVQYLQSAGMVKSDLDPDEVVLADVANSASTTFEFSNDGQGIPTLACPRGLRVSRYSNEYGDAETYYLA